MSNPNALISVSNKDGIVEFADGLAGEGWTIYSSGGTADRLNQEGVDAIDIRTIVGPAILGDRVKTLSRELHGGLLARKWVDADIRDLEELGAPFLDLVAVDMYPLAQTIASGASEAEVTEGTDVGGPAMLHSAAKGRRIVLAKAEQRVPVLDWIREGQPDEENVRRTLAATAEHDVATYILESARYLGTLAFGQPSKSSYDTILREIALAEPNNFFSNH